MKNYWKDGVFGVVVGDVLGCPVQFKDRAIVADHPVTGMRGKGTFNLPAGSWTDDILNTIQSVIICKFDRPVCSFRN